MARAEILTLTLTKELVINLNGLYLLGYAGLFGMCTSTTCMHAWFYISYEPIAVWVTFVGGT